METGKEQNQSNRKLVLDEWIVREVIDTLYMACTTLLGITGLDSPQEVAKKSACETAITRRIHKAIDIIQQSEQPKVDVNNHAVTYAFLKCERCGKIVSEMYGEKFNNIPRNNDKYLAFLKQVELDNRFGELAGILQRYGAMPEPKEQPNADFEEDLEQEIVSYIGKHFHIRYDETLEVGNDPLTTADFTEVARHFAEWGAEHLKR